MNRQKAFTLVELTLTLTILGIAAAVVAFRIQGSLQRNQFAQFKQAICNYEWNTRHAARQQDRPMTLLLDLAQQRITRIPSSVEATNNVSEEKNPPLTLPKGFEMSKLLSGPLECAEGKAAIPCSRQGLTPTYALQISVPEDRAYWFLWAGLSGQCTIYEDETQVQAIFDALSQSVDAR
jgi:prepilin-type N-terminal cleavage/methylation domain-containing protein